MKRECNPMTSLLTLIGLVAALFSLSMIPEMRRYLRMRRM